MKFQSLRSWAKCSNVAWVVVVENRSKIASPQALHEGSEFAVVSKI